MRLLQITLLIAATASASNADTRSLFGTNRYAPSSGDCPSAGPPSLRIANGLSTSESEWLKSRRNVTVSAMTNLLAGVNISGFDAAGYFQNHSSQVSDLPNIALAFSGGGYRAMLTGGGAIKAYDSREQNPPSGLEGLLQAATYVAGLSGGGWLVGSVFLNNFTTISALQSSVGDLWNLTEPVYDSPIAGDIATIEYYADTVEDIADKREAGFPVSGTDFWGRILSYRFINATDGGPSYTWSGLRDDPKFSSGNSPFPIVVADNKIEGQSSFSPLNNTVFEFAPFEMGTWDPTLYGFFDLKYLGSNFVNGQLASGASCIQGYDNAGFVIGTTSSYQTNLVASLLSSSSLPSNISSALAPIVSEIGKDEGFVAYLEPNPFKGWNPSGNAADAGSSSDTLYLVDGGTDEQNLPLQPLIQSARAVDVIVALDSSNDINGFPNGSAIYATYLRSSSPIANGTAFPKIPDTNTFVNLGLNQRPTFFGCNDTGSPIIVYIPNAPYITHSNTSTFQLSYTYDQRDAMIANGALVATQGNGSASSEFRACLGCAIMARSFTRTKTALPAACQTCFDSYCWNGTIASQVPSSPYAPALLGASPTGLGLNVTGGNNSTSSSNSSGSSTSGQSGTNDAGVRLSSTTIGLFAVILASVILF